MNDNLFSTNNEQIRSIVVSFTIFLIKEMYQENMLNSSSDKLIMAKYLDDKIDKFINEDRYKKERLFIVNIEQIRSIVISFCIFFIEELYQENVLISNADIQTMRSYFDSKIDIYIKEKKYRKERV